jgi:hypothetical protein
VNTIVKLQFPKKAGISLTSRVTIRCSRGTLLHGFIQSVSQPASQPASQLVVNWVHLAEDRDLWRSVVNTVMNLQFP